VPELNQIPRKRQFKTHEVCQLTDTQPYVLRFWESEFPQLKPDRRGGQPVYRRKDIDVVMRIKQLLYDEEYTIDGARKRLQQELNGEVEPTEPPVAAEIAPQEAAAESGDRPLIKMAEDHSAGHAATRAEGEMVDRERYDDAIEEIQHLRLRLQEFETALRKADNRLHKAEERAEASRQRIERTVARLEKLVERIG
jgi:DNA-binding transcriptional MerR regulator